MLLSDGAEPQGAALAVRDGGPYLVGRGPWLAHMVDVVDGKAPSVASSAGHEALRANLAREDGGADAIVVTAILPRDPRSAPRAVRRGDRAAAERRGRERGPQEGALDGTRCSA